MLLLILLLPFFRNCDYRNERILIIGGTGALGGTLAKRYYRNNNIMVVSRNEHKQEAMKVKYPNVIYRLGDVKDKPSIVRCLYDEVIIFK